MNAIIWSDFITCKRMLKQQAVIAVVVALAISLPTGTASVICPTVAVAVTISCAFSVTALDERNGWEGFRACMPLSRANIMWGRMGFIALIALCALAIGMVLNLAISVGMQTLGPEFGLDATGYQISGLELALSACVTLVVLSIMVAFTMPLVARFGMSSAMRYLMLVWAAVFVIGFMLLDRTNAGVAFMQAANGLLVQQPACVCVALVAFATVLFLGSGALCAKLYQCREF